MNNRQKNWLLIGPVVFSFALAMTVPVIQIYFMRLINSEVLAISYMHAIKSVRVLNVGENGLNIIRSKSNRV